METSPYDYSMYVRWMELLKSVGDRESLHTAQEQMYTTLAIPADTWLEWIDEELSNQTDGDNLNNSATSHVLKLYELAIGDNPVSIPVWLKYIKFVKKNDPAQTESVLLMATDATMGHYLDSQKIWVQYKGYLEGCIGRSDQQHHSSDRDKLVGFLQNTITSRLCHPHKDIESTFSLYSEFVTKYVNDSNYEQIMVEANKMINSTRNACAKRDGLEDKIQAAGSNSWCCFTFYIDKLIQEKEPDIAEIKTLYERGLIQGRYDPNAWSDYIVFVADKDSNKAALEVANRAVRTCPWSGKLWGHCIYLKFQLHGLESAMDIYARAMVTNAVSYSAVEYSLVALSRLNILRLSVGTTSKYETMLLSACQECISIVCDLYADVAADPSLTIERYCTGLACGILGNVEEARKMWTRVCKARKVCTEAWIFSAEFELSHGSRTNARSVYRHAAQRKLDDPERLYAAWLNFELLQGDLTTLNTAERFISNQRNISTRRMEHYMSNQSTTNGQDPRQDLEITAPVQKGVKRQRTSESDSCDKIEKEKYSIFVSNLPAAYNHDDIVDLFGGDKGVCGVTVLKSQESESFKGKGQRARVDLVSTEAVIAALDKNGFKVSDMYLSVHIFKQRTTDGTKGKIKMATIEVRGFSPETGNKKIKGIVNAATNSTAHIHRSRQGDVAFVQVKDQVATAAVQALEGCTVDGGTLQAKVVESAHNVPAVDSSKMTPRKVAGRKKPTKKVNVPKKLEARTASSPTNPGESSAARSNDDFRQMYLGSK